jgi:hypothetical protein
VTFYENVRDSTEHIRLHPLIPDNFPVHGLVIDPETGELELVVDGYDIAHLKTSRNIARKRIGSGKIKSSEIGTKIGYNSNWNDSFCCLYHEMTRRMKNG